MATSFAYVALTVGVSIRAYKTYYLGFHDKVCQSLIQRKKTGKLVASWSVTSTGLWASTEGRMWLCPGRAEKASRRWPFRVEPRRVSVSLPKKQHVQRH